MGCFAGCFALAFLRLVLFIMFLSGNYIGRASDANLWPVLGFFFMPLTTIASHNSRYDSRFWSRNAFAF